MSEHVATTQQLHPARASWRTAVQSAIGTLITLGVIVPLIVTVLNDQLAAYLPPSWQAWLVGAATFVAALSAAVARIMAIPAVDRWLKRLGLSSSPSA